MDGKRWAKKRKVRKRKGKKNIDRMPPRSKYVLDIYIAQVGKRGGWLEGIEISTAGDAVSGTFSDLQIRRPMWQEPRP